MSDSAPPDASIPNVRHGGPVPYEHDSNRPIDASASINPLGPPDWLRPTIDRGIGALIHYPDPAAEDLVQALAAAIDRSPDEIVIGNGASELFAWLPLVMEQSHWVVPVPSYGAYRRAPALAGRAVHQLPLGPAPDFAIDWSALDRCLQRLGDAVVVLGQPNNPTGQTFDLAALQGLLAVHPQSCALVDEAFIDFTETTSCIGLDNDQILVLRSATKLWAMPGLRLGWLVGPAASCARLRQRLPPWSVNGLAQRVGQRLLADRSWPELSRHQIGLWRTELSEKLDRLAGGTVHPTTANWLLFELPAAGPSAETVAARCRSAAVALRVCDDFPGLERRWLRIAVRPPAEQDRIVAALATALGQRPARRDEQPTSRAIMLQGCSSDAGKSVLTAALCRCLAQDGVAVAPFKAQNMSNNAAVDAAGGELGRAQAMQAQACGLAPDCRMNPVLLKPTGPRGCQVIIDGQAIGHHGVDGWLDLRERARLASCAAFDALAAEHRIVVCEGAGSPGEVNLKERDMVNMGFVRQRPMPVLLIGDIDRGGVYASFVGHLAVFDEWERARVAGFLVNRFRGDASLLGPAHDYVTEATGVPVLGVVPWLRDLGLPDEDRVALSRGERRASGPPDAAIDIAVPATPAISNLDDLDPFTVEADVRLRLVERGEELGRPAAVLLIGSKATRQDLAWLHQRGFVGALQQLRRAGTAIVGLCGGYQMLGQELADDDGVEADDGPQQGLAFLQIDTFWQRRKATRSTRARHCASELPVQGYEIHHGCSSGAEAPALIGEDGQVLGHRSADGLVWGGYLHGLFANDPLRHWWLNDLRRRRQLPPLTDRPCYDLEPAFDRLAACFRQHVDLGRIYQLLGLER